MSAKRVSKLRTYKCQAYDWNEREIVAINASKARYKYILKMSEVMDNIPFMAVKVRSAGVFRSQENSSDFQRMIEQRGIPFAKIGMAVLVANKTGTIVGHNHSANLDVIFDEKPNITSNCHPHWEIAYLDECGKVIKDFRTKTESDCHSYT